MKIKFENFRCYENKEFDLGENGLILLSGPSGSGKSTILNGIYFALFGEGNKVVSHGKTNCKVQIEHGTGKNYIKIIRTKKPNRVVLEMGDDENPEHMEDQAAQDIINKMYGDMFNSTGYVSQNAINSFILLSPTDKLTFLEQFAFKDLDLSSIKGRCKSVISKRKEQHISSIAKADMTNKVISDMHKPEDPIDFPIKHKSKLTIQVMDKLLKNEETTHKNTIVFINKTTK
jgi:DNA repair exonuclease SbcCD ATPase subunit